MNIMNTKTPFEAILYWILIFFASQAFTRGYDCFFYSFSGGTLKYNVIRTVLALIFLFIFAEVVNRKIVNKHSPIMEKDKDDE